VKADVDEKNDSTFQITAFSWKKAFLSWSLFFLQGCCVNQLKFPASHSFFHKTSELGDSTKIFIHKIRFLDFFDPVGAFELVFFSGSTSSSSISSSYLNSLGFGAATIRWRLFLFRGLFCVEGCDGLISESVVSSFGVSSALMILQRNGMFDSARNVSELRENGEKGIFRAFLWHSLKSKGSVARLSIKMKNQIQGEPSFTISNYL
jgi:hypothetical protein